MDTLNCTKQQIVKALDRAIIVSVSPSQVVDELDDNSTDVNCCGY